MTRIYDVIKWSDLSQGIKGMAQQQIQLCYTIYVIEPYIVYIFEFYDMEYSKYISIRVY